MNIIVIATNNPSANISEFECQGSWYYMKLHIHKLKRCSKKECCKKCSLRAPWQMARTKTNTQNSTKTTQNTKKQQTFRKNTFFCVFRIFLFLFFLQDFLTDFSKKYIKVRHTKEHKKGILLSRFSSWRQYEKIYWSRQILKGLKQILQVTR